MRLGMESDFIKGIKSHSTLWNKVRKELQKMGFALSTVQIINRWNALKKKYKKVTDDNNNKTGSERMDFKYLDEFHEVFNKRAATVPKLLIDSLLPVAASPGDTEMEVNVPDLKKSPDTASSETTPKSKTLRT
ncbi:hypothetical protein SNE40_010831 [Patella caerulea]|uniref:Myb/SANT-like DNA-binding domain-containing protein n=1 Tax=Patella caerulea TaxID=87958 RepID=A0AAN8PV78_PATCE